MAGGKVYQFQNSRVNILASFGTTKTISAITNANPAVVTATGHGFTAGELVKITGVVGMTDVNGNLYVVDSPDANTFHLLGVDSTNYGIYASGGVAAPGVFSRWCELKSVQFQSGTATEIDTTTQCSVAKEYVLGLSDAGTTQIDINYAPDTLIQQEVEGLLLSGALTAIQVVLDGSGGTLIQEGRIQSRSFSGAVDGVYAGSITMRNTGPLMRIAAS